MQRPRTQQHLVRPLIWRKGPEGLYPFELFWMEGKTDMEGFGGCFSYCFITKETQFHPVDGMVVHPYDEVLLFGSLNRDDMLDLGAEVSIEIGEERELYTFNQTYAVAIPKGTPHGPVKVKNLKRPFAHFVVSMDPIYSGKMIPASKLKPPVPGSRKYADYACLFAGNIDPETGLLRGGVARVFEQKGKPGAGKTDKVEDKTGMGYNRLVDERGVIHSRNRGGMGPGNSDNLVWLFGDELQGIDVNILWGHYSHAGIWHRMGECHTHTEEEILVLVGADPDDPKNLGACVELAMGEEDERYASTVPTAYVMPKNYLHLPSITRWADKPFAFIGINLAKTHDSPWVNRDDPTKVVAHTT
jgi:hypothetical protein